MRKFLTGSLAAIVLTGLVWGVAPLAGQEAKPAPSAGGARNTPLKVTVVIGRFQGEKRVGSLPFVLTVNTTSGGNRPTTMQVGSNVPIPSDSTSNSFQYRNIGTNIVCFGWDQGDGRYTLRLTITDNQIFTDAPGGIKGIPAFQNFTLENEIWLRDGQTIQLGTGVDKASGDVIKVDVTLNVIK
jgi:hypothetical protein